MITTINEFNAINEKVDIKSDVIDIKKLTAYANAIEMLCDGEYGYTYFNPETNYIAVCLGDASPFNEDTLTDWFKEMLIKDYTKNIDNVSIEIDCEWQPEALYIFKNGKWNKN